MVFFSTKNKTLTASLKEAIFQGLPNDNGLYMPAFIPTLSADFLENFHQFSDVEIATEIAFSFLNEDLHKDEVKELVTKAINFSAPLKKMNENLFCLELFHGPTLAFKDFGARFMALLMAHFLKNKNEKLHILVATSGDTGSAVAQGFLGMEQIKVTILYPKNKVSEIQKRQFTTLGENVQALEVEGTFDDCQALVKQSFLDEDLRSKINLSSANSINIARLIPQIFYYFFAIKQLRNSTSQSELTNVSFSVPSGNFGNLCAGIFAKKMGLKFNKIIAATNANKVFKDYLETDLFSPKASIQTISNAMDVGNPSNFMRLAFLYSSAAEMKKDIVAFSFSDENTREAIQSIYTHLNYVVCPHTAVAFLGAKEFEKENASEKIIFLSTAHPIKFREIITPILNQPIEMPERLQKIIDLPSVSQPLKNDYNSLKMLLISTHEN